MADGQYTWGVRPEQFSVDLDGALHVELDVIQPTGSRSFGTFYLAGNHMMAELDAHAVNDRQVVLSVAMERTLFFDPSSGQAVGESPLRA